ncbi:hypothetical protein [Gimesia maris]|uniref:hypothetical protein n=1 Tax=Gimesia maris TaxID=122 RepID=UPI003A9156B2
MTHVLKLAIVVSVIAISTGCQRKISGGSDLEHATSVTSSEFKEALQQQPVVFWIGFDDDSQYCIAEDGFYKIMNDPEFLPRKRNARWARRGEEGFGEIGVFYRLNGDHLERASPTPEILEALKHYRGEKFAKTK